MSKGETTEEKLIPLVKRADISMKGQWHLGLLELGFENVLLNWHPVDL